MRQRSSSLFDPFDSLLRALHVEHIRLAEMEMKADREHRSYPAYLVEWRKDHDARCQRASERT